MNWRVLIRPEVQRLQAYESARSIIAPSDERVFLDANESPDDPRSDWNRYPEPQPRRLLG